MVFDIWVIRDIFLSWRAIGPNWKGKHYFLYYEVTYRKCDSSSVTNKKSGTETGTAPTSRSPRGLKESPPCEFLLCVISLQPVFRRCILTFSPPFSLSVSGKTPSCCLFLQLEHKDGRTGTRLRPIHRECW